MTLSSIGDGVITTDKYGCITFMNQVAEEITGWCAQNSIGIHTSEVLNIIDEISRKTIENPIETVLRTGVKMELTGQNLLICKYGKEIAIADSASPIVGKNKEICGVVLILRDATDERQHQKVLSQRDATHKAMIANITDVIAILDKDSNFVFISPNILKWFGWSYKELVGVNSFSLVHPDDIDRVKKIFDKTVASFTDLTSIEFRFKCKDGSYKYIITSCSNMLDAPSINGILLNFHDISQRKKLEEEKEANDNIIRNQQKLESVGTLASGVAHEINNPINGIMNYAQVILDESGGSGLMADFALEILGESKRIADIVKNLLDFSRNDKQQFSKAKISDIINKTMMLINAIIKKDEIIYTADIPQDIPDIECRSQQIQQIIMNLVTNARDALNAKYQGYHKDKKIELSVKEHHENDFDYIRISVKDHGNGMPKSLHDKIFDPFFSTKGRNDGTGLGLAISYGIAKEHNGNLSFETKENEYTIFYLDLPTQFDLN